MSRKAGGETSLAQRSLQRHPVLLPDTRQSQNGKGTADSLHILTNSCYLLLTDLLSFFIIAILTDVSGHLIVVLIWIFPMMSDTGIISYLLAICVSLKKCLSKCLAHF